MVLSEELKAKAQETRIKNQAAKMALYQEQAAAKRSALLALTKVFESADATPAEILRAGELLAKLDKRY